MTRATKPKNELIETGEAITTDSALLELRHIATALESIQINYDKPGSNSSHSAVDLPVLKQMKGIANRLKRLSYVIFGSSEAFDSTLGFVTTLSLKDEYNTYRHYRDSDIEHIATSLLAFVENMLGQEPSDRRTGHQSIKVSELKKQIVALEKEKSFMQPALARLSKEAEDLEMQVQILTQESIRLKGHITELQKREIAYLKVLRRLEEIDSSYSLDRESRSLLLGSYQRQRVILLKNLMYYQEIKAKSGLNTPINVLHSIEDIEKEIEQIDASIKNLGQE